MLLYCLADTPVLSGICVYSLKQFISVKWQVWQKSPSYNNNALDTLKTHRWLLSINKFPLGSEYRVSSQAGRLMMRKLISEKMAVPWNEVCLERTPKGKPFLARPAPPSATRSFSFNISHQGDFAVLAAERGLQVGVDVMKTSRPGRRSLKAAFCSMAPESISSVAG